MLIESSLLAQSPIHFSQYGATPMHINPAATGAFYGSARWTSTYRNQWSFTGNPYTSMATSFDAQVFSDILKDDYFAVGLTAYNDVAGVGLSTLNQANLSLAYGRSLDAFDNHIFSLGFQGGYSMHSLDFAQYIWERQWNGSSFDPTISPNEPFGADNFAFTDFSAGIHYFYSNHSNRQFTAGMAMYHLTQPAINYFGKVEQIYRRLNFHVSARLSQENSPVSFCPSAILINQGPNNLFMFGHEFLFRLQEASQMVDRIKEVNFSIGTHVRWRDALVFSSRVEWGGFMAGVSFDVNLSSYFAASRGSGGPEIVVGYIGGFKKSNFRKQKEKKFR